MATLPKLHNVSICLFWCYNKPIMPRQYRKVTPAEIAQHKVASAVYGNGTQAVRALYPTMLSPSTRAFRIVQKSAQQNTIDFIDDQLQQIGVDAVNRLGKLVNSVDEKVATKNAHYVVDHIRGQAVRRTESKSLQLNIEAVL